MLPPFRASSVIFDLDGTLVDTAPDLTAALNHVLLAAGGTPLAPHEVRHMVGQGARALIERGIAANGDRLADADHEAMLAAFLRYYATHIADYGRPFDGAAAVLQRLAAAGLQLGICTNKPQALALALLDAIGLRHHFAAIVGADAAPEKKPHPAHLTAVLSALGRDGPAVMVGDSPTDVAAARACGMPVILVDYGYSRVPAAALGADAVISRLDALEALLCPMAARKGEGA
ncbi:MAG: phosphoglycolate phosphatase [Alphaproteobacteria bacterium]|nr:MAG: phosphoglycolate phosphatase [Alphaproteobacteria bacterium]